MKRYLRCDSAHKMYDDSMYSGKLSDREITLLKWAGDNVDPDLTLEEQVSQAEDIAYNNGWLAFDSADEEFEHFWNLEEGDVKQVLYDFDTAYGNGDRFYPMDYGNGAQEEFYEWVKENHPEADTSSVDFMF